MATDKVISTLNDLIETCRNGEEGYREAAEKVKDSQLTGMFQQYADQRGRFAVELQSQVRRLGGEAETDGSAAGSAHRGWMDLRAALQNGDRHAILSEVERGEDAAKAKYEDAREEELPGEVRQVVDRQYSDVLSAHDRMRALRDATDD